MGNFFIGKILKFLGGKLDGYKTKIGGVGLILTGLAGAIGYMFPDQEGLPKADIELVLGVISLGWVYIGNGGKQEKLLNELRRLAEKQGPDSDKKNLGL
jgi:hypothetical protein